MKKIRMFFMFLLSFLFVKGQENTKPSRDKKWGELTVLSISETMRIDMDDPTVRNYSLSAIHDHIDDGYYEIRSSLTPETRKPSFTACVGKTYFPFDDRGPSPSKCQITPKLQVVSVHLESKYIGVECDIYGIFGKFKYFSRIQYVTGEGITPKKAYYEYGYFKSGYKLTSWLRVNAVAQIHVYHNYDFDLNQGGEIELLKENFSLGAWYSFDIKRCIPMAIITASLKF